MTEDQKIESEKIALDAAFKTQDIMKDRMGMLDSRNRSILTWCITTSFALYAILNQANKFTIQRYKEPFFILVLAAFVIALVLGLYIVYISDLAILLPNKFQPLKFEPSDFRRGLLNDIADCHGTNLTQNTKRDWCSLVSTILFLLADLGLIYWAAAQFLS